MSRMVEFAKGELRRLGAEDDEMQQMINKGVIDIVEMFSKQGHSGFSASYTLGLLKMLLAFKPLTPLTGDDDEWVNVHDDTYQNKRYSAVFKKGVDNSTAYNIEGKVFSDDGGKTWFSNNESHVPITFPYEVPEKPEYIILNDEEKEQ